MKYINKLESVNSGRAVHPPPLNPNQSGHPSGDLRPPSSGLQFTGQFSTALHEQHRSLDLSQVLALVREHLARHWWSTEVVGSWVWVYQSRFLSQAERSALFELRFHWNPRRQVWQHPCAVLRPGAPAGPLPRYIPAQQESQSAQAA